jgi:uncharacterized protein (TIGR00299 family) protein
VIGFLDLPAGLSGDMLLGCLVDAGFPVQRLRRAVEKLGLPADKWSIDARQVMKGAFRATFVEVQSGESHHHRGIEEIRRLIGASEHVEPVKARAIAVFERLAAAEAKVHGTSPDKVHFHEVGAVDALIDIVGGVAALYELGVEQLLAGPVPIGEGWVQGAHGPIPVPGPATLELLAGAGARTRASPGQGECLTPTGAAMLAELARFEEPALTLERVAVGAGSRDTPWPNVARLLLGRRDEPSHLELVTNIDDMNPQLFAATSDRLLAAGALDVWLAPIQMKKGRPGVMLTVIAPAGLEAALSELILRETTTLGIRVRPLAHRHEARREVRRVETPYGPIRVKVKWLGREAVGAAPEYDDCLAAAQAHSKSVREVHEAGVVAGQALLAELRASKS